MATLSTVLHQEPTPISSLNPTIPADLEKLINRCLRKDPAKRFRHMDDLKVALDELREDSDSGKLAPAVPNVRRERCARVAALLVGLLLVGSARLFSKYSARRAPAPPLVQLTSYTGSSNWR